jgi:hypothetical protein
MQEMVDREKIYGRYLIISKLAVEGAPGERDNAQRLKLRFERDNPWLFAYHQQKSQPTPSPNQGFNWDNVFNTADRIFSTFRDFTDAAYGMQRARLLADQCIITPVLDNGTVSFTIAIPQEVKNLIDTVLTPEQKDAFMETFLDRVYQITADQIYPEQ